MKKQYKKLILLLLGIFSVEIFIGISVGNIYSTKNPKVKSSVISGQKSSSNGCGINICTANHSQHSPVMCEDGNGGAIIAWFDRREADYYYDIYVQKVDSSGKVKWSTNGKQIYNATSYAWYYDLQIWSDGEGGAILYWKIFIDFDEYEIYVQKIDANGNVLWEDNGLNISNNSAWPPLQMCSDGSGGAIFEWEAGGNAYTQRITSNGTILWTYVCSGHRPTICTDTLGGAIFAWYDIDVDENIYAQRVNTNGNVLWGENGTIICNAESDQFDPWICSDGDGGAFVSWLDDRSPGGSELGTYIQKIDGDGNSLWDNNGTLIPGFAHEIISDEKGGLISYYYSFNEVGEQYYYGQRINSLGNKLWGENGTKITCYMSPDAIFDLQFCSDGEGGALYTWNFREKWSVTTDPPYNDTDIYVQKVNSEGEAVWKENGLPVCVPASNYRSHDLVVDICNDEKGGAIISYEFIRAKYEPEYAHLIPYLWDIHAQLISSGGQLQGNVPPNIWLFVTIGVIVGGSAVAVVIAILLLKKRRIKANL